MTIYNFNLNLELIIRFASKLKREDIPFLDRKSLIRTYANSLNINLTNNMVNEILFI